MSTYELLPEGRLKLLVGTSELSTGFLDSFRSLWKPATQAIGGPTLQQSDHTELPFPAAKQLVQIGGAEEDKECYDGRVNTYGARNIDRSKKLSIYDVKKRLSNGNTVKTQRRNSTSTILRMLRHQNIDLSDLFEDKDGTQPGATVLLSVSLDSLIHCSRRLSFAEADYCFKQVVSGVEYLYTAGIAHRDLNPDNLILTSDGTLKITNFSQAESFFHSRKSKSKVKLSSKKCGSLPYIAPEVLVEQHFDPRPVDMWALAIVYMEMRTGKLLWNFAAEGGDEYYDRYLRDRSGLWGYRPVENLENESCRNIMRLLLDPRPKKRPSAGQVLGSSWMRSIEAPHGGRVEQWCSGSNS